MSLELRISNLIDKHQGYADNYHRKAEQLYLQGHFQQSVDVDNLAHKHEVFALELREELKKCMI